MSIIHIHTHINMYESKIYNMKAYNMKEITEVLGHP